MDRFEIRKMYFCQVNAQSFFLCCIYQKLFENFNPAIFFWQFYKLRVLLFHAFFHNDLNEIKMDE